MASNINAAYPQVGSASTANVRNNFSAAVTEIEALQNAVGVGGGSGGTVNIDGGTIDGTVIGGSATAAGSFTAISGTTISGSGDLNIDAGLFVVDVSEDRVGINTTTPDYLLHVHEDGSGAGDHSYIHFTTADSGESPTAGCSMGYSASEWSIINARSGSGMELQTSFSAPIVLKTDSSEALRIDASQNIGCGVTPESWGSGRSAFQLGGQGAFWNVTQQAAGGSAHWTNNVYYDGADNKYIVTDEASDIYQQNGEIYLRVAAPGTADTAISFTTAVKIEVDGGIVMSALPTADPTNAGELWNDSGTLKVSAG